MKRHVCVCVPVRNEAQRLPVLLDALADQTCDRPLKVVLCVNNSDDGSALAALGWGAVRPGALDLDVVERRFPPPLAHAGSARRVAMDRGAEWLDDPAAILVCTDADCRPPPDWIEANLQAFSHDDRIVGGRIMLDEREPLDADLVALRSRWDRYWVEVRAIEDAADPTPWDPPPRHGDHTGASLALTVGLYRAAGGCPPSRAREDLGLVEAALAAGGRLVHPNTVWTRASARTDGRATGGMAAEMARLAEDAAAGRPPMAPHFDHWRRRAVWRAEARRRLTPAERIKAERAFDPLAHDMALPELA